MRGSAAALLLLRLLLLLHAAAAGNGGCARSCGALTVQYPFGFSPGCEIPLGCDDQANGTAWVGGARELGLLVSNVTARAVVLVLPQDCSRGLNASIQALFSKSYAPGSQNALVVSKCSPASPSHTSNCSDGDRYLDRSSRCNATTEPIRCVLPPSISSSASVHRFFNRIEMQTLAAECTGLVSAASYWDAPAPAPPALLLGVMELEWWVGGTCRCSRHATCTPVTTPTAGQQAFRCECHEGFHGDGFVDGAGCWKDGTSWKMFKSIGLEAGLSAAGMFMGVFLAVLLLYYLKKWRTRYSNKSQEPKHIHSNECMDGEFEIGNGPRRFSYSELSKATRGFSEDLKLGEGGFGSVYRGFFHDQRLHVAIKRVSKTSRQGRREYISEVTIISRLRHRNLVQLVGWCHDADELLLVYELMENGSLDTHLYNSSNVLPWPSRYSAVLSVGYALLYLHEECEKCVLHRDIKPSNVMLDASFNAKLGDFGLARFIDHSRRERTTMLAGTIGYMDPECAVTSRASVESDMYSFGVVLLEIACGRQPIVQDEDEKKVRLIDWVWHMYGGGKLLYAADARLNEFDVPQMERVMLVGLWCVHPDHGFRPSIRQAMSVLQFVVPPPDLPRKMMVPLYYMQQLNGGGYRWHYESSSAGSSGDGEGGQPSMPGSLMGKRATATGYVLSAQPVDMKRCYNSTY